MRKQRLRPQRWVSWRQGIMRTAMISRNSVIAVWTPFTVVSRSSLMSLIITFMFEPAKLQMNSASASGRVRRRAALRGRSWGSAPAVAELSVIDPILARHPGVGTSRQGSSGLECRAMWPLLDFVRDPAGALQRIASEGGDVA